MKDAISILKSEHRSISAILQGLKELARMALEPDVKPDFHVLRCMLRYIDEYPEQLHNPKEDDFIFDALAVRAPEARALITQLKQEHEKGAVLVRELERALLFLEEDWPAGARQFKAAVDAYAEFEWAHMRKEEQELLPLAQRYLTAQEWRAIDAAFAANDDPVAGLQEKDFRQLFTRIATLAPAPVGLGDPWKQRG
jgi:hemerythrin-like domain-containing protein